MAMTMGRREAFKKKNYDSYMTVKRRTILWTEIDNRKQFGNFIPHETDSRAAILH